MISNLNVHLAEWMFNEGGWRFLLPPPPYRRLLCYDVLEGATLFLAASLAEETWVVHHDAATLDALRGRAEAEGVTGLRFLSADDLATLPPAAFDGALLHDPLALVVRSRREPELEEICRAIGAGLRPGGFLYVGMRNRLSYARVRGRDGLPRAPLPSVARTVRALRAAGLEVAECHPFLMAGTRFVEMIPPSGYRSAKNSFRLAERARAMLLRGWGRRHLAPSYGIVAFRETAEPSWLERLGSDPWVQGLAPQAGLRRYLVLGQGKLILSLGDPETTHGGLVLVVTPTPEAAARRRSEARWLLALAQLPAPVSAVVPVFHGEQEIAGLPVFALSERPGMTVDADADLLPALNRTAARWLLDFHRVTVVQQTVGPEVYARVFGVMFDQARLRNPPLAPELDALEERLRTRVLGQSLPIVWMHGDFKLENVVFDESSHALQGVIDWELAQREGPPVIDLEYLLLYDRVVRQGALMLDAISATVLGDGWTADERAILDEHHAALGSTRDSEGMLAVAFVVHHIGARFTYDLDRKETVENLRALLAAAGARLGTAGGAS